nr:Crp/Fnr family transcriptional regulator [Pseudomonas sp.]
MTRLQALQQQKLLTGLDLAVLQELADQVHFEHVDKRAYVIRRGSLGESLVMLVSGRLQVIAPSEDGREVGLHFVEPGDYLGEIAVIDGGTRSVSVVAAVPSTVALMPANIARKLFTHHPIVAERLLLRLCHTIRQSSQIRSVLGMARAFSRIYAVLHAACQTHEPEGLVTLENLPSQQAIALTANVSRETVSRAMQALFANKIVEKDNRRLIVRNPAALAKLARGEVELRVSKGGARRAPEATKASEAGQAPGPAPASAEPAKT